MPVPTATDRYRLDPAVSLRDEPFGGLAYHYGTRQLLFLQSRLLVDVLRQLDGQRGVEAALDAVGAPLGARGPVHRALTRLTEKGIVRAG